MNTNEVLEWYENCTDMLKDQYTNLGVLKKEIRSYEVSLWTLQDEFITVLKWSDVEQKSRIENPKMVISTEGTETFSFSIPMKIIHNGVLIENPNWYNVTNGNLISNLRKIKVIFHKNTEDEAIYEFVISQITESHKEGILSCEVTCESLAFSELGKLGYKVNLSPELFYNDYYAWANSSQVTDEPIQNIDYWCNKAGLEKRTAASRNAHKWYYSVDMNWRSYEGSTIARSPLKIYEESYAVAWNEELQPTQFRQYTEKARPITVENSNLFNITQQLAETFGVFCRYEYLHDENYHITGRTIVFYNNFTREEEGIISLNYSYESSNIERSLESTNLTTKLYVLDARDTSDPESSSIMNSAANPSGEDYILNFDYLYQQNAITKEQYEAIPKYLRDIRALNKELTRLQNNLSAYQEQEPKLQAQKTLYQKSVDLDMEQITQNSALLNALDVKDGVQDGLITLSENNPDILYVNSTTKQIDLKNTNKGIKEKTIRLYETYNSANKTLSNEITSFVCVTDSNGNLATINNVNTNQAVIYATYSYDPLLYYDAVVKSWQRKLNSDEIDLQRVTTELGDVSTGGLLKLIEDTKAAKNQILNIDKPKIIQDFEQMMGPALREGYWQPENYMDYGDSYAIIKNFSNPAEDLSVDTGTDAIVGWDTELFDSEDKITYIEGSAEKVEKTYVCINLNEVFSNNIPTNISNYSLIFNNNYVAYSDNDEPNAIRNLAFFAVGSQLKLGYVKYYNTIIPVLIFLYSSNMANAEISHMKDIEKGRPRLAIVNSSNFTYSNAINLTSNMWIEGNQSTLYMAYPRIKFSSQALKTEDNDLIIHYAGYLLTRYQDYYLNKRNVSRIEDNNINYYMENFITIKPEVMFKYGQNQNIGINYIISNASTAIYNDAKKISLENAYPKVSYNVDIDVLNTSLSRVLYNKLARLVIINDTDLKLEDAMGYISQIELDLDNMENDKVEIKNYKNRYETLFSTILAQTEAMKYNAPSFTSAAKGQVSLTSASLLKTLEKNQDAMYDYLNEYYNNSPVVQDQLESLFTEASQILSDSTETLGHISNVTDRNANLLNGFVQNVAENLTSKVFRQEFRPEKFKKGDIWIRLQYVGNETRIIGTYIATANSSEITGDKPVGFDTRGFTRTHDGTLASITGAAINIDAEAGQIDVEAQNYINIKSGNDIYIAANHDLEMVGNHQVNIGGTEINLCTLSQKILNDYNQLVDGWIDSNGVKHYETRNINTTGINLIAGEFTRNSGTRDYTGSKGHVLISPERITMGASELYLRAASRINLISSTGSFAKTSAISISAENGVYIGAGAGVRIYSGPAGNMVYVGPQHKATFEKKDIWIKIVKVGEWDGHDTYDHEGDDYYSNYIINNYNHAQIFAVEGVYQAENSWDEFYANEAAAESGAASGTGWTSLVSSGQNAENIARKKLAQSGASIELNKDHLIIGYKNVEDNAATAVEITEDFMIIASGTTLTGTSTDANLAITGVSGGLVGAKFTKNSIGFATSTNAILMDDNGVTVGSGINVTQANIKGTSGSYVRVAPGGVYIGSNSDLYINSANMLLDTSATGHIFELKSGNTTYLYYDNSVPALFIHGQVQSESFVAQAGTTGNKFMADSNHFGLYTSNNSAILTVNGNSLQVASSYTLDIGGNIDINSTNLIINSSATGNNTLFKAMNSTNGILVEGDGDTTVTGTINATGGTFTGNIIANGTISGGTISGGVISGGNIIITGGTNDTTKGTITIGDTSTAGAAHLTYNTNGLEVTGALTATSLIVGSSSSALMKYNVNGDSSLIIGDTNSSYMQYNSNGLTVQGAITATSLTVGSGSTQLTYSGSVLSLGAFQIDANGDLVGQVNGSIISDFILSVKYRKLSLGSSIQLQDETTTIRPMNLTLGGSNTFTIYTSSGTTKSINVYNTYFITSISTTTVGTGQNAVDYVTSMTYTRGTNSTTVNFINATAINVGADGDGSGYIYPTLNGSKLGDNSKRISFSLRSYDTKEHEYSIGVGYGNTSILLDNFYPQAALNDAWDQAYRLHPYVQDTTITLEAGTSSEIQVPASSYGEYYTITYTAAANSGGGSSGGGNINPGNNDPTPGGGGNSGTCFAAGTPILLTNGTTVPIEKMQLDMEVMAYDEETHEYLPSWVQVVQKIINRPMKVLDIYLSSGEIITATSSHPILTARGWCAGDIEYAQREHKDIEVIDNLQIGDQLISPLYENIYIEDIIKRDDLNNIPVYNLNVEPTDTYIAGGIVVHNDDSETSGGVKP